MSEKIVEENQISPVEQEHDESKKEEPKTPTMAKKEEPKTPTMAAEAVESLQHETKKLEKVNISFSIWPPTHRTRDAVINRLIETLSAPSVLSKRYGTLPHDEAAEVAHRIESDAFAAASASASSTTDEDGMEILQLYSREISKLMLEAVKSRSTSASTPDNGSSQSIDDSPNKTPSEEISSVETET